jgi:hypothetical protein
MGLKHGDLRMTISDHIEVDRYKAKMGTDEDVCVVNFHVESREAGQDLVNFLESGYEWILDAAVSPGTNRHGKYMVFVEMERNADIRDNVGYMLKEVSKVAELEEWKMRYSKSSISKDVTEETLSEIPNSSESYNGFLTDSKLIDNIKKAINI